MCNMIVQSQINSCDWKQCDTTYKLDNIKSKFLTMKESNLPILLWPLSLIDHFIYLAPAKNLPLIKRNWFWAILMESMTLLKRFVRILSNNLYKLPSRDIGRNYIIERRFCTFGIKVIKYDEKLNGNLAFEWNWENIIAPSLESPKLFWKKQKLNSSVPNLLFKNCVRKII
jgi:hypothetical protein